MMRRLRARLKSQRGQALILFVGIFTIIAIAGAITVDFGLWFSERRGAQTDADLSALAGAQEYMRELAVPGYPEDALGKAQEFFDDNNAANAGNASLPVPIEAVRPCVKVTVKHDTKALFTSIFGLGPNNIGASAKACAGALTSSRRVIPIQLNNSVNDPCFTANGTPNYPSLCLLEGGAQSTQGFTDSVRGVLDLDYSGAHCSPGSNVQQIADMILNGAPGTCKVNSSGTCGRGPWDDCALVQTGNAQAYALAFKARIARQGSCDDNHNGIEEFLDLTTGQNTGETLTIVPGGDTGNPLTSLYEARVCPNGKISPRIVKTLVLGAVSTGNSVYPIVALDSFYIAGCSDDSNADPTSVSQLDRNCTSRIPAGHISVWGQFVNLTESDADVGTPTPGSTLFGIALVE